MSRGRCTASDWEVRGLGLPRPVPRSTDEGVACAVSDAGHREIVGVVVGDQRSGAVQRDEPRAEH